MYAEHDEQLFHTPKIHLRALDIPQSPKIPRENNFQGPAVAKILILKIQKNSNGSSMISGRCLQVHMSNEPQQPP